MGFFTIVGAVIGTIGGIIGAIGGALSLHDRYVKSRPIASLTSIMQGSQKLLAIRIKNTIDHDIVIDGATELSGAYFLAEDFDIGNIIRGQVKEGMFPPFMLKPAESKELILMPRYQGGVAVEALGKRAIEVRIDWRKGNTTSRKQRPIILRADTQTLRRSAGVE
jgi:hypothetical protein